jgi:uncharacterized repeat protein (TIGR01451 family)
MTQPRKILWISMLVVPVVCSVAPFARGQSVYVSSPSSNSVVLIDGSTDTATAAVSLAPPPAPGKNANPIGVAITPDTKFLYVVDESCGGLDIPGSVSVIDTATFLVVATIPVEHCPQEVVISPDGSRAYVTNRFSPGKNAPSLSVIDTSTKTVIADLGLPADPFFHSTRYTPSGLAITPDGKKLYIGLETAVSVLDSSTNTIIGTIGPDFEPPLKGCGVVDQLAVTPDGAQLYVAACQNLFVFNTSNNAAVFSLPPSLICTVAGLAIAPDGKHAYVADSECGSVFVIDTATHAQTSFSIGNNPGDTPNFMAVGPDSSRLYITTGNGTVAAVSTATNTVIARTGPLGANRITLAPTGLILTKSASPMGAVHLGDQITYTLRIHNGGPNADTNVVVTDALPAGVQFVSSSITNGSCSGTVTVVCTVPILANRATATATIVVTTVGAGSVTNSATVSGDQPDPFPLETMASAVNDVRTHANLQVNKTASPANLATPGSTLTYQLSVVNNGPDPAFGVTLTDNLPLGLTISSITPSQGSCQGAVVCNLGRLNSGASATVTIVVVPQANVQPSEQISNTATVAGTDNDDPNPSTNSSTVVVTCPYCLLVKSWRDLFHDWEAKNCPAGVPVQNINVAYIFAQYADLMSSLTAQNLADRVEYIEDYYFQQSMCTVVFHSYKVNGPLQGWIMLPQSRAQYDQISPDPANNFVQAATIWKDAFVTAAAVDPNFLLQQQLGNFDAVVVVEADSPQEGIKSIRSRAFFTNPLAKNPGVLALAGGTVGLMLGIGGPAVAPLLGPAAPAIDAALTAAGPGGVDLAFLADTLFRQGSVITNDTSSTETWAHELGHALFDFWDYYGSAEALTHGNILDWDLMSNPHSRIDWTFNSLPGIGPPSPVTTYNRAIRGWVQYQDLQPSDLGEYLVDPLSKGFAVSPIRYKPPRGQTDWFIIEHRQPPDSVPPSPDQNANAVLISSISAPGGLVIVTASGHGLAPNQGFCITGSSVASDNVCGVVSASPNPTTDTFAFNASGVGDCVGSCGVVMASALAGDGAPDGVVIYRKREIRTTLGVPTRIPLCAVGSIHGFAQWVLSGVIGDEFGSCLEVVQNRSLPGPNDPSTVDLNCSGDPSPCFTLLPGTSYADDDAGVVFSARKDANGRMFVTISDTPHSRTLVTMEASGDLSLAPVAGGLIGDEDPALPVDLHVYADDGSHMGWNASAQRFETGIAQGRSSGPRSGFQWISFPDNVAASYSVDASEAIKNAQQLGTPSLNVTATVTILHYDANANLTTLVQPVEISLDANHTSSAPVAIPVVGDTIPPVTSAVASPAPNAAGWNNSNVTLTLNSTDNEPGGSGVKQITYSATGAQTISTTVVSGASASLTISVEGTTTITFYGTDNAGNVESPKTLTVMLDKTPPSITSVRTPPPNANGWNNTSVTVSFQCSDALSGLAAGSPPAPTTLSSEGAGQSVSGTCTDVAGNAASATVSNINIDKTAPTVACSAIPSILWPPNNKLVPISTSVTVSDALSGSGGFTLVSVTSNEPDSRQGDIQGFVTGTASTTGFLRAQRLGSGTGRVYTLTYSGADGAGNTALCTTTVLVPHDQGN